MLRRMRIDRTVVKKITLRIETDYFATRTKTRVQCQHPLGPQRRSQQQLTQVFRKNPDSFFIGPGLADQPEFIFYRRLQQAVKRVFDSLHYLARTSSMSLYKYSSQPI